VAVQPLRRHVAGVRAIDAALDAGEPVRMLLVGRDDRDPELLALVERARAAGVELWLGGPGDLRRMGRGPEAARAIAMLGPAPRADLAGLFERGGAVFLMHRARYASNVGFAVRSAEVAGAAGIVIDGDFNHEERTRISHVSMGADRLFPVLYEPTASVLDAAARSGHRVIAIEDDAGARAPWEVDLTGDVVLIAGGERDGIGPELLARCALVVRVPMAGFVPSYNLQAALSAVASERLRQLESSRPAGR
jgi:23S rRNA (guanosine2251-2'-O)-methyltransferase